MSEAFPKERYETDAEERRLVATWLERDTEEGMAQYTRIFASMVGLRVLEDMPEAERMRIYMQHPPVDLMTMQPPPDAPGVLPQWQAIQKDDQGYYRERVEDFFKLYDRWRKGDIKL